MRLPSRPALAAVSAERASPLPCDPPRPWRERLAAFAREAGARALASAREAAEDFRRSDRFFKYKALIVASWLGASVATLAVACPGARVRTAELGSRLVVNAQNVPTVLLLANESEEAWREVVVVVNGQWRASLEQVEPGSSVTLTPRQLMGAGGMLAPDDLVVHHVELRTEDGDADLLVDGERP